MSDKMSMRPDEMTSKAGFGLQAVVWKPLLSSVATSPVALR